MRPTLFTRMSKYLATILGGIGDAMVSLPVDRLAQIMHLLLRLWALPEHNFPKGEDKDGRESPGRAAKSGHFSIGVPSLEQGLLLFSMALHVSFTRAMKRDALVPAYGSEWLRILVEECKLAYEGTEQDGHPAMHYIALFAAGGMLCVPSALKKIRWLS